MKVWSKVRGPFGITYLLLYVGIAAAWLSKEHAASALIGPAFRPDEAYTTTLRRWQQERRNAPGR
jgi:hypothetical protein